MCYTVCGIEGSPAPQQGSVHTAVVANPSAKRVMGCDSPTIACLPNLRGRAFEFWGRLLACPFALCPVLHLGVEEAGDLGIRFDPVGALDEAVAFVLE